MNDDYKRLKPAPTLGELAERIKEAIEICGPDATWNGFDDEAIYIHAANSNELEENWVRIAPA